MFKWYSELQAKLTAYIDDIQACNLREWADLAFRLAAGPQFDSEKTYEAIHTVSGRESR
jgi:hypothetical protein